MSTAATAEFAADFSAFNDAVNGAKDNLSSLVDESGNIAPKIAEQAEAAGREIAKFGKEVIEVAGEYVKSFAEEQEATVRLTQALKNQGTASEETITAYQRMGEEFQNTTKYSDDAITKSQALFASIGNVGPEQMRPAIEAAANLASGLGISLEQATRLVAAAFESGGEKLGRLSRYLDEGALKGKGMGAVLDAINAKFGGQATAEMQTYTGQVQRLENQIDNTKESIGGLIASSLQPLLELFAQLPAPVQNSALMLGQLGSSLGSLVPAFAGVVTAVSTVVTSLGGWAAAWAAISGAIAPLLPYLGPAGIIAAGIGAWAYVFKNADVFLWAFAETWKGVSGAVSSAADAIVGIAARMYEGVKSWIVDKFTAIVGGVEATVQKIVAAYQWMADKVVLHSIVPDMMAGIGDEFGSLPDTMVGPTTAAAGATVAAFKSVTAAADEATQAWINSPLNLMSHNMVMTVTDAGGIARDAMGRVVTSIPGLQKTMGQQNISVTVNGSVLSTQDQLASVMQNAMIEAYRKGGNRLPV